MNCNRFVKNIKPTENSKAAQVVLLYLLAATFMYTMSTCNIFQQYAFSVSAAFTMKALSIIPNRFTEFEQIFYSLRYVLLGVIIYTPFREFDPGMGYYISLAIGWIIWLISFAVKKLANTISIVVKLSDSSRFLVKLVTIFSLVR